MKIGRYKSGFWQLVTHLQTMGDVPGRVIRTNSQIVRENGQTAGARRAEALGALQRWISPLASASARPPTRYKPHELVHPHLHRPALTPLPRARLPALGS